MKRFFFLLCVCPLMVQAEMCLGSHFKAQAMTINDAQEREAFAQKWLKENIPTCKPEQLRSILSSSPLWLGTALSARVSGLIEAALEAKSLNDPAALEMLLNPPLKKMAATNNPSVVQEARVQGGRNAPAPVQNNLTSQPDAAVMTQAAAVAAAAATAAAIVQNQNVTTTQSASSVSRSGR